SWTLAAALRRDSQCSFAKLVGVRGHGVPGDISVKWCCPLKTEVIGLARETETAAADDSSARPRHDASSQASAEEERGEVSCLVCVIPDVSRQPTTGQAIEIAWLNGIALRLTPGVEAMLSEFASIALADDRTLACSFLRKSCCILALCESSA